MNAYVRHVSQARILVMGTVKYVPLGMFLRIILQVAWPALVEQRRSEKHSVCRVCPGHIHMPGVTDVSTVKQVSMLQSRAHQPAQKQLLPFMSL
jgi:hypothetical protein